MVETPSSALYLLGNIQTGKSKKQFQPSYAPRAGSEVWTEHSSYLWKGFRGEPQKNVLVPRFFLTFFLLDVPSISRSCARSTLRSRPGARTRVEIVAYFSPFGCSLVSRGRSMEFLP